MICGGSSKIKSKDPKKILEELRDVTTLGLEIQLNNYKLAFNNKDGDWKSI